uniref:intramembrane prenyl-peptidase Rce1 n=1 Tax=Chromera velia CCMP2878 TaxID=1169474 RepID=A0A0G4G089_9ALVE|mmetsp:Transcript_56047/g.109711  ORF Transcript_56047/g.109711 Transcript_56047/m.109711 type:complete len:334 (-) Transcript_56047:65-1066(-)|eukprot:Cvel_19589.t1-p1 / transcript=Cvel_19589.t1 / gene=Cvel_19589 / organism=Chromera_velia_CCMP2878 / gene_product=CAAX prenyl protease 2, putative / transcript_product=CAAX prenyl protease 2, putative / location=Cvel_scaffold1702:4876-9486(+) / protein_length=333 / sequence_SO=supercontig / SO=protein_coding / is_pseudo=false
MGTNLGVLCVFRVTASESLLFAVLVPVVFVGSLYVWDLFGFPNKDRESLPVVLRRFASLMVVCAAAGAVCVSFARPVSEDAETHTANGERIPQGTVAELLGIAVDLPLALKSAVTGLLSFVILFLGPLSVAVAEIWADPPPRSSLPFSFLPLPVRRLLGGVWLAVLENIGGDEGSRVALLRNVILAPLTEEWMFRCCTVPLLLSGGWPPWFAVFVSPLFFGLAHLHHLPQLAATYGSYVPAAVAVLFQLVYTSVFGAWAAFLFYRCGHSAGPLVLHTVCNWHGLPNLGFLKKGRSPLYERRTIFLLVYGVGILLFAFALNPLTEDFKSPFRIH